MNNKLNMLDSFKTVAIQLKTKSISKDYWLKEEVIIKERIEITKKEAKSISMSNRKFHKMFSL